jgi:hypothetical protein
MRQRVFVNFLQMSLPMIHMDIVRSLPDLILCDLCVLCG